MIKRKWQTVAIAILIPLIVGGVAGFLTKDAMSAYGSLNRPPLAPPGWLFGVVWPILYILMGIGSYFIWISDSIRKESALRTYLLQLLLNFLWPIVFFNLQNFLLALVILLWLWLTVLVMIARFRDINPLAGNLQIPYLLWLTFAIYLNAGVVLLN